MIINSLFIIGGIELKEEKETMPIGFSMSLAQDKEAMQHFALLDKVTQNEILNYIKQSPEGMAKERIVDIVHKLHHQMIG